MAHDIFPWPIANSVSSLTSWMILQKAIKGPWLIQNLSLHFHYQLWVSKNIFGMNYRNINPITYISHIICKNRWEKTPVIHISKTPHFKISMEEAACLFLGLQFYESINQHPLCTPFVSWPSITRFRFARTTAKSKKRKYSDWKSTILSQLFPSHHPYFLSLWNILADLALPALFRQWWRVSESHHPCHHPVHWKRSIREWGWEAGAPGSQR